MIVRFDKQGLLDHQTNKGENAIGVEGDPASSVEGKVSEVEKIVSQTKAKIAEGYVAAVGVSASNSGKGHDLSPPEEGEGGFKPTVIEGSVEEEPVGTGNEDSNKGEDGIVVDGEKTKGGNSDPPQGYEAKTGSA